MPGTQRPVRPYFYNFLAAFRAHHAFRSAAPSSSASASTSGAAAAFSQQQQASALSASTQAQTQTQTSTYTTSSTAATNASSPRPITHKSTLSPTAGVSAAFSPASAHHPHSAHRSLPITAPAPVASPVGAARTGRRGSDASSDSGGFRERVGGDAWFVGGRTAAGEERFYRLGMVKRERSGERASVDRMSL